MSTSVSTEPVATGTPGTELANAVRALGVTHIICVPDTMQKTAIDSLAATAPPELLYVCTEDEAIGINAGLYITGHQPMLLIQNNGLYACINTLKAIALDAQVPTFMLIGQYGRDVTKTIEANTRRQVHRLEPTLDAWGVPHARLEGPADLPKLRAMWDRAWETKGPAAALVGTATS
jgi:sulfopyruvate decarboxylase TPP-binding subunit